MQWLGCFEDFFMKNALLLSQYIYNQQIQKTNTIDQKVQLQNHKGLIKYLFHL